MGETRWTPGPYKAYSGDDTNGWWVIHDSEDHEIGSTDGGFELAEAHLFAAATELYSVVDRFVEICDSAPPVEILKLIGDLVEPARAARAKARGEQ